MYTSFRTNTPNYILHLEFDDLYKPRYRKHRLSNTELCRYLAHRK